MMTLFLVFGIVLFGYSEKTARRKAEAFGKRHAKRGVEYSPELVIQRLIKSEPTNDPAQDSILKAWHEDALPHPLRTTWESDLDRTEQELAKSSHRWTLRGLLAIFLLIEFTAVSTLLMNEGIENPERAIISAAGACLLFFLFYKASEE